MSTTQFTERDAFNAYIESRWGGNLNGMSLEEALLEFRAYQRELADARHKVREAIDSSDRGESHPLDDNRLQEIFDRCDAKLKATGIQD